MSVPLTVLMTVYNGGRYLKETVASVLRQTYRDFELLIIDDGSSDDSLEIIETFGDKRIRIEHNPSNLGQTKSLNIGLKLTLGEYVARIDADDMAFPYWLEKQVAFAKKNAVCAVVSAQAVLMDEVNRIQKPLRSCISREEILLWSLTRSPVNHVGSLMRRDIILENGGYDENFKVAADYELWSRLLCKGYGICSNQDTLTAIRVHSSSVSIKESTNLAFTEVARIIRRNFSVMAKQDITETQAFLLARLSYDLRSLNDADLAQVVRLVGEAYHNLGINFSLDGDFIRGKLKKQIMRIITQRVFIAGKDAETQDTQKIVGVYFKEYGYGSVVTLFFLISFMGKFFLGLMPAVFEWFSRIVAKVRVGLWRLAR